MTRVRGIPPKAAPQAGDIWLTIADGQVRILDTDKYYYTCQVIFTLNPAWQPGQICKLHRDQLSWRLK